MLLSPIIHGIWKQRSYGSLKENSTLHSCSAIIFNHLKDKTLQNFSEVTKGTDCSFIPFLCSHSPIKEKVVVRGNTAQEQKEKEKV